VPTPNLSSRRDGHTSSNQHGLNVTKPVSLLNRSIKFSFKDLFESFTKAVVKGATAKYADALGDAVDALASVSLGEDYSSRRPSNSGLRCSA
jgi:hypothetical protein